MKSKKMSGSAIFMHSMIWICIFVSLICFYLHYIKKFENSTVLWCGIVAFMIVYHFWVRLICGNISKLFTIDYRWGFFKEKKFEKHLYKLLRVKKWKDKALTYNPSDFSLKDNSIEKIISVTAKSEVDHWINEIISVCSLLFSLIWGQFWIFLLSAIVAMIFDSQFILIQRYNRPRLIRLMNKNNKN